MKFLYKIYSNFDGFTPRRISERLINGRHLILGWKKYLDTVDIGAEVWVYFYGRHAFTPGVYVKGFVSQIFQDEGYVLLRVRQSSQENPLTDPETTSRIADAVSTRNRQVFLWPSEWDEVPVCNATSCERRLCGNCESWKSLQTVQQEHYSPPIITASLSALIPAYWIIPNRCYVYREQKSISLPIRRTSHMFYDFKLGEARYAYPLARGIFNALTSVSMIDFDAIVPIPLSPDKVAAGELHRTRILATELSRLLGARVCELVSLEIPISKRRTISAGGTIHQFKKRYYSALSLRNDVARYRRILLVDDVVTSGTTLGCVAQKIQEANPESEIVATSAGQMIIKGVVLSEVGFSA